jgi:hypothetical protein
MATGLSYHDRTLGARSQADAKIQALRADFAADPVSSAARTYPSLETISL